ncbi:MAG: bifunctional nicotinamidase/pyrazinamidase [Saprospiraceae bacterium]|nr:bifunctional nicotinamidase/pyrazinamidase [Saprospiraceae bacterium]
MKKALIIIDVQNDFTKDGNLAVPGGEEIIPFINNIQTHFETIIASQDWHPADHGSFASNHKGKKPFEKTLLNGLDQVLWPDHCVQGSAGAEFHPDLVLNKINAIIRKGMDPEIDSYSAFFDNGHRKQTGLAGLLFDLGIKDLFFCGLAADYCVYYSIKDALAAGFHCNLFLQGTRAISSENFNLIKSELAVSEVKLID